ncbi:hypothetical protein [Sphingobacterium siyangense]|uniref:hypothetical protein n=1 Tax=Sphingobacterium siyangense TaxID=459529 RepID=UPI00301B1F0C
MKLKHAFRSLAVAGLALTCSAVSAQDVSGIYNVDISTGTANVNIPVTSSSLGGNEFGASIHYNTKGVPVREFAGIVGNHWQLQAGGSISRVVKGLPDEWYSPGPQEAGDHPGSVFLSTYNQYKGRLIEGMETPSEKNNPKVYRDPESDEYYFSVGSVNFQFFLGREGAIYCNTKHKYEISILTEDGLVYKDQPLPTLPTAFIAPMPQRAFTFRVKDPQSGLTYYFSRSVSSFMNVAAFYRGRFSQVFDFGCYLGGNDPFGLFGDRYRVINTWKLDSVISAANEKISYTYERFIYPVMYNMDTTAYRVQHTAIPNAQPVFPSKDDTIKAASRDPLKFYPDSIDLVKEIIYPYKDSRLIFHYEKTTPRLEYWTTTHQQGNNTYNGAYYFSRLNEIEYREQNRNRIYKFNYTYFHTPNNIHEPGGGFPQIESDTHLGDADDMYSLKLKSLSVKDNWTGNYNLLYSFGYNDNKARRFAKGLDYHGYFNGGDRLASETGHSIYGLKDREPDSIDMQYAILKSVTSGTGGRVSFDYDIHKLSVFGNNVMNNSPNWVGNTLVNEPGQSTYVVGDGLKIKRLTLEDINNIETRTHINYTYDNGQYFLPGGIYTLPYIFHSPDSNQVVGKQTYESFMNPAYFHNGCNHAYSTVVEQHTDRLGQQLSATEYQLTNFSDSISQKNLVAGGGQASVDFPFTRKQYMRSWEMGLPLKVKTFDNKGFITSELLYTYQFVTDTMSSLVAKINDTNRVLSRVAVGPILVRADTATPCAHIFSYKLHHDPYRPYKGLALLKKLETRNYINNSQYLTDISTYDYDSRNNVRSVRSQNSNGTYIENYSVYNYDIVSTSDPALIKMQQEGSEYLVATEKWSNGTGNPGIRNSNSTLLKSTVFKYNLDNGAIYNEKVMESALVEPLSYSTYMNLGFGNASGAVLGAYNSGLIPNYMRQLTEVKRRDSRGNPLETYLPQSETYKSMIWDINTGNKLADVANARYTDIAYTGFEYGYGHNLQPNTSGSIYILPVRNDGVILPPPGFIENVPVNTGFSEGKICLLKLGSAATKRLYTIGLEPGKEYRATFWASNNTIPEFGIEGGAQFTLTKIATRGQYNQYEVIFTPTAANQKIGLNSPSKNVTIDELRIHPVEAQMTTYTYQDLNGTVSETDALGRITFYEYDGMGRLHIVRNQEGNIIQKKVYGTQVSQ